MGGVHLPMENLKANPQLLEQEKPVLLYCASGKRSYELVKILQQVISSPLYTLKGGMKAWLEAKTELP
jgi:adenylyltransferase/sulfurtransferase